MLLLAVAAFELDNTEETRGALLEGLQTNPLLFGLLHGVDSGLEAAVFAPDGSKLVTPTSDGRHRAQGKRSWQGSHD